MTMTRTTQTLGYSASASLVARSANGLRTDQARLVGVAVAVAAVGGATLTGILTPTAALIAAGASALMASALLLHSADLAAARDDATDRLIELDAFAPAGSDPRVAETVNRRRRCLVAARNRLALASAVRRDARRGRGLVAPPPAARLLAECPLLAARIAEELECDQADERLVIEVTRMLSAGAPEWDRLDRIEHLIDQ